MGSDEGEQTAKKDAAPKPEGSPVKSKMEQLFGFKKEDLTSWHALVALLNRPTDPASLGIFRCLFGKFRHHPNDRFYNRFEISPCNLSKSKIGLVNHPECVRAHLQVC